MRMRGRRSLHAVVALALAVAVLFGCRVHNSWRQKLVVEVETPQGVVTGASVIQVESWFGQLPASGNEVNYEVTGEATVVDFGGGRYLFALLGGSAERFYHAVEDRSRDRGRDLDRIARMQGESRILKPDNYPTLVTFADINDPSSVTRVDPDDLAAGFGPGYALSSITLAITDEPVTKGRVEAVLGWLESIGRRQANLMGKPKHGLVSEQPDPAIYLISPSDFSTELYK